MELSDSWPKAYTKYRSSIAPKSARTGSSSVGSVVLTYGVHKKAGEHA